MCFIISFVLNILSQQTLVQDFTVVFCWTLLNNIYTYSICVCEQDSPDLMLLLRMLSLGQGAWDMIDSQVFKEPRLVRICACIYQVLKVTSTVCRQAALNHVTLHENTLLGLQDLEVVTRFLPAMMSVVVDDHTFTVEQKLPSEEKSSLSYPNILPDAFNR